MTDANTRRRLASLAWIVHDLIELIGSARAPDTKKDLEELIGRLVDDETGQVTEQVTGQVKTPGEQKVEVLKFETLAELEKRCALQLETIRHLRERLTKERDELKAENEHLKHATSEYSKGLNRLTAERGEREAAAESRAREASAEIQALKREVDAKCNVICDLRAELNTQRQSWAEHGALMARDAILRTVWTICEENRLRKTPLEIEGHVISMNIAELLKGGSK